MANELVQFAFGNGMPSTTNNGTFYFDESDGTGRLVDSKGTMWEFFGRPSYANVKSLEAATWAQVAAAAYDISTGKLLTSQLPNWLKVGATKSLFDNSGTRIGTVRIIGHLHDVSTNYNSCGLTFEMVDCLKTAYKLHSSSSCSRWEICSLRTELNGQIFNTLTNDIKPHIKAVLKQCYDENVSQIVQTVDKLWLLSASEIFDVTSTSTGNGNYGEGTRYTYYINNTNADTRKKTTWGSESATEWWLRSPCNGCDNFIYIDTSGNRKHGSSYGPNLSKGVSFCFCI